MSMAKVLIVDDHRSGVESLGNVLRRQGSEVSLARTGDQGLTLLKQEPFHVLFSHLRMPDTDGVSLLRSAFRLRPRLSAVVVSDRGNLDSCLKAIRLGACDYVARPFTADGIKDVLLRALEVYHRRVGADLLPTGTPKVPEYGQAEEQIEALIAAQSASMGDISRVVERIASSTAAVLIRGEPGVGKGLVARAIHRQSRRAHGPFVQVACGAIREAELDARLFGRALPNGSNSPRQRGLLESATGGSFYLANVDRLPSWAQLALYDALQRGAIYPSADGHPVTFDIRTIASTACDLEGAVGENRFYDELYYLLNVVVIDVPPIRQQNVRIWVERCLAQLVAKQGRAAGKRPRRFTRDAWESLLAYDWPGNLPEMTNVIARAVAMTDSDQIGRDAIVFSPRKPCPPQDAAFSVPVTGRLREIERVVIEEVIHRCRGNKAAAARALGLHRRTLYRMLESKTRDGSMRTLHS